MNTYEEVLQSGNIRLPSGAAVEEIEAWEFIDSVGDPAVRVVVVLPDAPEDHYGRSEVKPIRDEIFRLFQENGIEHFPYVRFVTKSEIEGERALR